MSLTTMSFCDHILTSLITYKHTSLQLLTQTCINIRTNAHKICTDTQNKLIK